VLLPIVNVAAETEPQADPAMMRRLPELPRPSPGAEVKQRVGITDMQVSYSSPGVKGRTIWGELVPYDKIWRTGANAPTKLTVSRDFTFGGKEVKAGRYSVFTIPTASKWTVILNKDPNDLGSFEHDPKLDVVRVEVTPAQAPPRERMTFLFEDSTDDSTKLVLDWGGLRVTVPITVATKSHVEESIASTMKSAWRPLFNAGRYALDSGNHAKALELFQKSIGIHATWWNHWWAAQVLAKQGQHHKAREHAKKAMELGKGDRVFERAFAERVQKALASWPAS
jgi:hypothetical protein